MPPSRESKKRLEMMQCRTVVVTGPKPPWKVRKRLVRGEIKRGRPLTKIIWVPAETVVAGRTSWDWARHCLAELAANGASLDQLRDFCNQTGIPGRRKQYRGTSTWHALVQPSELLQYCGYGVWNVRTKTGRERPPADWIIVPNAHRHSLRKTKPRRLRESESRWPLRGSNLVPKCPRAVVGRPIF